MKKIPLTQGQFALVSDEWYKRLMQRHSWEKNRKPVKWCACWDPKMKSFYAHRKVRLPNGKRIVEQMHRRILGLLFGDRRHGDHINHQTLDNQPDNLRIVTPRENHENRRDQSKHGVGIYYRQRNKLYPFRVLVRFGGKKHHIGVFATEKEAVFAREALLRKLKGDPACYKVDHDKI